MSDTSGANPNEDDAGAESDGTGTEGCGCVGFEIEIDDSYDGATVEELVEATSPITLPWTWTGIEGEPITLVHLSLDLVGNASVMDDECGLDLQCVGVSGGVLVNITTDDGRLNESMDGSIWGTGTYAQMSVTSNAFTEFQGTLPDSDFIPNPKLALDNAGIGGSWSFEDGTVELLVYVPHPTGYAYVLGLSG